MSCHWNAFPKRAGPGSCSGKVNNSTRLRVRPFGFEPEVPPVPTMLPSPGDTATRPARKPATLSQSQRFCGKMCAIKGRFWRPIGPNISGPLPRLLQLLLLSKHLHIVGKKMHRSMGHRPADRARRTQTWGLTFCCSNQNCVLCEQKRCHRPPLPTVASAGRDPLIDRDSLNFVDVRVCGTGISWGTKSKHPDRPPDPPRKTANKMYGQEQDIVVAVLTRFTPPPRTGPFPGGNFPG